MTNQKLTETVTRAEARARGLSRYFPGSPCRHGHVSEYRTEQGDCVECKRERDAVRRAAHREENREYAAEYRAEHREELQGKSAAWKAEHPAYQATWRAANLEKERVLRAAWRATHPEKRRMYASKRRSAELLATPPWADHSAIETVFSDSVFLEQITGAPHHVDHVVPLQGPNFSGLHVHYNLRPMVGRENQRNHVRLTGADRQLAWPNDPVVNRESRVPQATMPDSRSPTRGEAPSQPTSL